MPDYSKLFLKTSKQTDAESKDLRHSTVPSSPEAYFILFVDDEPHILSALKRVFRKENYQLLFAPNAEGALALLAKQKVHLMITDYKMPGMSGADLLRKVKTLYPDCLRIMLTGQADTDAIMAAMKEGAVYRFILKPWNDNDLRVTVALALEQYELQKENSRLQSSNKQRSKEISLLTKLAVTHRSQMAIMLNKKGLLNDAQVQQLYKEQQSHKTATLKIILDKGWLEEKTIHRILKKDFLFEEVNLPEVPVNEALCSLIPQSVCRQQMIVPLSQQGRSLMLAMADPMNEGLIDEMKFTAGLDIKPVLASSHEIIQRLDGIFGDQPYSVKELESVIQTNDPMDQIEIVIDDEEEEGLEELLRGTDEPPAIRLVNAIILEAMRLDASDIHIQPRATDITARFRIDGVLHDVLHVPVSLQMSLVSRIKVMAEMDITERRRPQDGRITVKTPLRVVDLRISTLPTINGEKVVMRILDRNSSVHSLHDLGISGVNFTQLDNAIRKPQGIILATGPTGSGKTTTLYSLLQETASPEKNYITVEDPVEYYLEMAGQVMIKEKIGLNFAQVLRAILRQDPDVILVGEIRDFETAEVAFHAALTGHLVYSTLHTNSALDTLARLFDLGLKPYVLASALEAIVAQRLVRKICDKCRTPHQPAPEILSRMGPKFNQPDTQYFIGKGCDHCQGSGLKGRAGIYEILVMNESLRHAIGASMSPIELAKIARKSGMKTLVDDALEKVHNGITPLSEILRVLGPQADEPVTPNPSRKNPHP